jgi:hypothetical protein
MARKRKAYAPFSLTSEAGVAQTPLEGYIDVDQQIYPTVNTGTVNENGKWSGVKASDDDFIDITKHVAVANGGETLSPDTGTVNFIDMTGFNDIQLAVKPTNAGNYAIEAVMGPDTNRYANLSPVNSGAGLRGNQNTTGKDCDLLFRDTAESFTADVWNILSIQNVVANIKLLQFKITNNSGGNSDIEVAFMRLI